MRRHPPTSALMLLALLGMGGSPADASPRMDRTALVDGGTVPAPAGWTAFCRTTADPSCATRARMSPMVELPIDVLKDAQAWMAGLPQRPDPPGEERWEVAGPVGGDCEDLVLAVRQRLLAAGVPLSAIRIATAFTETKENHAVLTVDGLDQGRRVTMVLDPRLPDMLRRDQLLRRGYSVYARQSGSSARWVATD